jgi:hypothetical protein
MMTASKWPKLLLVVDPEAGQRFEQIDLLLLNVDPEQGTYQALAHRVLREWPR